MTARPNQPAAPRPPPPRRKPATVTELARGMLAEKRVLAACRSEKRPPWIFTARYGSKAEDRRGIDIVLETDVGRLYLQVKSSRRGMAGFTEKRRRMARIAIVVVRAQDPDAAVVRRVERAVGEVRGLWLGGKIGTENG